ncbi:MAG: CBS domain-containing protein [Halobacteriales archaeon]|nr:CBS domain-containing protein [Halobacteriales archaeon]
MEEGALDEKLRVRDYMTHDVDTVNPDDTVLSVAKRISESDEAHSGFPVTEGRQVDGFITARDLLLADDIAPIFTVMTDDLVVAHPEMKIHDAGRVILRSGIQRLPVVDDAGNLVGIISNADVVRSQIERATPSKVRKLMTTLTNIHGVETEDERRTIRISELIPTQSKVYTDELQGRRYELENGLAEPLVVIDNYGQLFLADGHHRVKAAHRLGIDEMEAYVIVLDERVELGMAETARKEGLEAVEDITEVDYGHHPLVETTHRLIDDS